MNQGDFLQRLVSELEGARIPFMISGSVASGYHGEARATYDVDIVIEADLDQVESLTRALTDRCYVSTKAARDAVERKSMFNVVDLQSGVKADLMVRKERPFSVVEFARRQQAVISGVDAFVATPEDCILSKLEWSKLGDSGRQYDDARSVAGVMGSAGLDVDYLRRWAKELRVEDLLEKLLGEIDPD